MKTKLKGIIAFILIFAALCGCTSQSAPKNLIKPKELSESQQEILDLVTTDDGEYLIYNYNTVDKFQTLEVWVEIYKDGKLQDKLDGASLFIDEPGLWEGNFAIGISRGPSYTWDFKLSYDGVSVENTVASEDAVYDAFGRGRSDIIEPVEIESGKEIVLAAELFVHINNHMEVYNDPQKFVDEPETLSKYAYVQLIKCKFNE